MKKPLATVGAAMLVLVLALPAKAADAVVADGGANVRAGPGLNYRIIASLPAGTALNIGHCTKNGQWCRARVRGGGWVAFSRLGFPYTGRPGEENYGTGADGEPARTGKILGIVVDKPGYCYALDQSGASVIVKCP